MTAQIPEKLIYQGEELKLFTEPLESYFQQQGHRPKLPMLHTACYRGYVGTWQIEGDGLYLLRLRTKSGSSESAGTAEVRASLETLGVGVESNLIFPEEAYPVFADWYSGVLRCPQGKMQRYVHADFASEYQHDLLILIEHGRVVDSVTRDNEAHFS